MARAISKQALAVSLVLAFAGCGGRAKPVAPPSNTTTTGAVDRPMAGTYRLPHAVEMVCDGGDDGWCEEQGEDTMTIGDPGDGSLNVAIELVRTNGHTCSFEGALRRDATASPPRWVHHSDIPDDGPCTLTLEQSDTELQLQADGCRYYCGTRASLDAAFPYPP